MEVKKYDPFVVIKPEPKTKTIPKAKIKLEAKGLWQGMEGFLSQENNKEIRYYLC